MSVIKEQINALRDVAQAYSHNGIGKIMNTAADTIEELSTKLASENMERSTQYCNNGWIPVSERLPETEELVLIQVSGKPRKNITFYNAFELASYSEELGWILEEYPEWEDAHPVAWQPLPEPYKEG